MQSLLSSTVSPKLNQMLKRGLICLVALSVFFIGQIIAQAGITSSYSASHQAISDLGITTCGTFKEQQTKLMYYVCSPLHLVMNGTFIVYGALIMLATMFALRTIWPGKKLRKIGLVVIFFGGIESVVAGFSPLNDSPFLHSLSGGLAIAALNIGIILLGLAAVKKYRALGWFSLLCGGIGFSAMMLSGSPPYPGLGYGGWERVAGSMFAIWGIGLGIYWLRQLHQTRHATDTQQTK